MIATIFRGRHTGLTHRNRGRQRVLALAAAAFVVVAGLAGTPFPAHATPSPSPSPTSAAAQETAITAAVGTTGTLRAGEALRVTVDFDNTTDAELPGGVATVAIGSSPLATSEAMRQWLDEAVDVPVADVSTATVPALGAGKRAATTLTVPATSSTLQALTPGVYPFRATLQAGGSTLSTRGVFTVETAGRTTPVALVVPVTAPPASRTLIDAKELTHLTAPDGALTAALDAADDATVVLAVDPAVVASIRVLGNAAPPSAAEWLARLEAMPNDRFALQFADADVASQFDAGLPSLMQPESLASFMVPANFENVTPSPSPTPAPDATATPDVTPLPTLEQLTDVGATVEDVLWPATGTVTDPVLAQSGTATLLTASGQVGGQPTGRANAGGRSLLVYDEPTSTAMRAAAATVDPAARAAAISEMVAASAFSATANAGVPGLVVLDRGATLNPEATRAAVAAFRGAGNSAAGLAQLRAPAERPATLTPAAVDPDHVARVQSLLTEQTRVGTFATVLVDPSLLIGRERARLLQTIAAGWAHQPRWTAAYDAQQTATTTVLESVRVVGGDDLMIVGSGVNLPVSVRNNLPFAVSADLIVQPADLRLKVQRVTKVEAGPGSTTRARVPVTGVSNGETTLRFSLVSAEGIEIGPTKSVRVTVRADWERIGLVVLAVLAAGLFGFGTLRTIRRRRRGEVEARPSRKDARAEYRKSADAAPSTGAEEEREHG